MRRVALVFAGGFCGTLARYFLAAPLLSVATVFPGEHSGFPFDIFLINLSGALALGLLYGLVERGARISLEVRLAVGTGFLGAYTTFSSLAYGGQTLLTAHAFVLGVLYLAGGVALGVACARTGYRLAGPIVTRHRRVMRGLVRARRFRRSIWSWRVSLSRVRARIRANRPHGAGTTGHESRPPSWGNSTEEGSDDAEYPREHREHEEQEVR